MRHVGLSLLLLCACQSTELEPRRFWVTLAEEVPATVLTERGLTARRAFHNQRPDPGLDQVYEVVAATPDGIAGIAGVIAVEEAPRAEKSLTPNDPLLGSQYPLSLINASAAWNEIATGCDTVIAVIDDAIDVNHPDLAANLWVNPGETPGNGIDDDGNGYIDDIHGWDFGSNDADPSPPSAAYAHGTHVAGTVSAVTNNGVGIASIGYSCKVMALKASSDGVTVGYGYSAVIYAVDNGARIVNCSWSAAGLTQTAANVIAYAQAHGAIVVAAAGNNNNEIPMYPATYANVISVTATQSNDARASFASYGPWVDIAAPGNNVFGLLQGNDYGNQSGTSAAAAMVSGTLGLMASRNPALGNQGVIDCLLSTTSSIAAQNPAYAGKLGSGRLDAAAALGCVHATLALPPIADFEQSTTSVQATSGVTFSDRSTNNPTAWSWTFAGGTPGTFSGQVPPRIIYAAPGVYAVSLMVENANGTDTKTVTSAVTVTPASACASMNDPPPVTWTPSDYHSGTLDVDGVPSEGWINGANAFGDKEKAAFFDSSGVAATVLWRARIKFGVADVADGTKLVPIRVYDGTSGSPGTQLGTATLTMSSIMADVAAGRASQLTFATPISLPVSRHFFVAVDVTNLVWTTTHDQLSITSNTAGETSPAAIWEKQSDNNWYHYGTAGSWPLNTSLYVFADVRDQAPVAQFTPMSPTTCAQGIVDFDATGSNTASVHWELEGATPSVVDDAVLTSAFYPAAGSYDVTLDTSDTCGEHATATTTVVVKAAPQLVIAADKVTLCAGESVTLTASGASSVTWSPAEGLSAPDALSTLATPSGPTTYTVSGAVDGCVASTAVALQVLPTTSFIVSILADKDSVATATDVTLTAVVSDDRSDAAFAWTKNDAPVGDGTAIYFDPDVNAGDVFTCAVTVPCAAPQTASITIGAQGFDPGAKKQHGCAAVQPVSPFAILGVALLAWRQRRKPAVP